VDRDWRLAIDVNVGGSPKEVLAALESHVDVDREDRTILGYSGSGDDPPTLTNEVLKALAAEDLSPVVIPPVPVQRWTERHRQYLDPEAPIDDEDAESWTASEIAPTEIRWVVRVKPVSVFEDRRVRREVRALGRPITARTKGGFEVGARDEADAIGLAMELAELPRVASATPRSLGWLRRWLFRQRLLGNYWSESGDYFYYHDGGVWGDGGGGGGDGGGGGREGH